MNHRPVAISLIACEQVIVDETSRNLTPVNCFGARELAQFPEAVDFHVVAWLADGMGDMTVVLVVRRLDTLDEVKRIEKTLRFNDPLTDMRFVARIRDCLIPVSGYYEITLSVDGEFIAHRRIRFY